MLYRFDLCDAHYLLERDYNVSGVLQERKTNQLRKRSTGYQLHRMGYKPGAMLADRGFNMLSDKGKEIYVTLLLQYGLLKPKEVQTVADLQDNAITLVNRDFDVYATLALLGLMPNEENNPNWIESKEWLESDYRVLFVLWGNAEHTAVWAQEYGSVAYLDRPVKLLYFEGTTQNH